MSDEDIGDEDDQPSRALVELRSGRTPAAIVPDSVEGVYRLSQLIIQSGMAPNGYKTPQQVSIAIMTGMELGLTPMAALQSIAVINGRPTLWGDAVPGLCRASGKCDYIKEWCTGEGDERIAYCETKRKDEATIVLQSFSITDAREAGLLGKQGPWQQYRRRMLQMRARSFCLRDAFGDVLKGLPTREEAMDHPEMLGPIMIEGNPLAAQEMAPEGQREQEAKQAVERAAQALEKVRRKRRTKTEMEEARAAAEQGEAAKLANGLGEEDVMTKQALESVATDDWDEQSVAAEDARKATEAPVSALDRYRAEIAGVESLTQLETHYKSWLSVVEDIKKNDPQMADGIRLTYVRRLRELEERAHSKR